MNNHNSYSLLLMNFFTKKNHLGKVFYFNFKKTLCKFSKKSTILTIFFHFSYQYFIETSISDIAIISLGKALAAVSNLREEIELVNIFNLLIFLFFKILYNFKRLERNSKEFFGIMTKKYRVEIHSK